jgi:hypothetical protein
MNLSRFFFTDGPEKRAVRRCVPPQLVTTSLLDGGGPRFGTLFNICNFGACFTTDAALSSGKEVGVVIGFEFLPQTFETRGRVVWSGSMAGAAAGGHCLQGVRFTGLGDVERETLRRILGSRAFQDGPRAATANEYFEEFLRELGPEIDGLGRKLCANRMRR